MIKKLQILIIVLFVLQINLYGQNRENSLVPLSKVFHDIGFNVLHSMTYNYGLNFIGAAAGTYILIETGLDWQYNRLAYNNLVLAYMGFPALFIGYVMPAVLPISFYLLGRNKRNEKLQITGLALVQSLAISAGYFTIMKGITGRISPGIVDVLDHNRNAQTNDYSGDFAWGFGKRGFIAGWPSGHTTIAMASAAVISEIYNDNIWLKAAAYSYAAFIGIGMSFCVHWSSEVFAGALIGYAVGKTVGKSFNRLLNKKTEDTVSLYFTPVSAGVKLCL
ncbi:MAG: phosphatase PAP2 family protein [Treponema sp.]|jgi:membrane-associated phospholipid phosphatase|nr:phosphatase PAP2 family protein [Treponema sp.]